MSRSLLCLGHSFITGSALSSPTTERFTALLASWGGYTEDNDGHDGGTVMDWTAAIQAARGCASYDSRFDIYSLVYLLPSIVALPKPDAIVIMGSHNDANNSMGASSGNEETYAELSAAMNTVLAGLHAAWPTTPIVWVGMTPFTGARPGFSLATWQATEKAAVAAIGSGYVVYADPNDGRLASYNTATHTSDGAHPNAAGNVIISAWVQAYLPSAYSLGLRIPTGAAEETIVCPAGDKFVIEEQASASSGTVNTIAPGPYLFLAPSTWVPGEKMTLDAEAMTDVDTATLSRVALAVDTMDLKLEQGNYPYWVYWGADASGDTLDRHPVRTGVLTVT